MTSCANNSTARAAVSERHPRVVQAHDEVELGPVAVGIDERPRCGSHVLEARRPALAKEAFLVRDGLERVMVRRVVLRVPRGVGADLVRQAGTHRLPRVAVGGHEGVLEQGQGSPRGSRRPPRAVLRDGERAAHLVDPASSVM
jgi:hypothetical protein